MKVRHILTIGLLSLLFSCGIPEPSAIEFDGSSFELPIQVDKAKQILGLQYGYYSGFYKGDVNDKSIATQLEDYPMFMGSDTDSEKSYYDKKIVGITFFKTDKTLEQYKRVFENQYHKTFLTEIKDFGVTRTIPPFNMTYHFIQTDGGLIVALKEMLRKTNNKKYISISFYKGIPESKLGTYLEQVH